MGNLVPISCLRDTSVSEGTREHPNRERVMIFPLHLRTGAISLLYSNQATKSSQEGMRQDINAQGKADWSHLRKDQPGPHANQT